MRRLALAVVILTITAAAAPFTGRITQGFSRLHRGIDLAARYGTIVRSIGPGTVVFAGWRRNCGGWQVYVKADGYYVTYNHMSRILATKGDVLDTGTRLGKVGSSGKPPTWAPKMVCSTGSHLHLEVWLGYPWRHGSRRVDPTPYIWPVLNMGDNHPHYAPKGLWPQ